MTEAAPNRDEPGTGAPAVVMKFGGSCLVEPADLALMVETVRAHAGPVTVILSAIQGVTESLIRALAGAQEGRVEVRAIAYRHYRVIEGLPAPYAEETRAELDRLLDELEKILLGVKYLGESSHAVRDRILSYGERLAVAAATGHFHAQGLRPARFDEAEAGLLTNPVSGNARFLEESAERVRRALGPTDLALLPGFIGRDPEGRVTTLGRGGSDYSAAHVAAALRTELILWKDVEGFRTADPRTIPAARLIAELHYLDALELAHYGSKVIFDKAIVAAMRARVPIQIRGFGPRFQGAAGTRITDRSSPVLAVAHVQGAVMIDLLGSSEGMLASLSDLFARLADDAIYPLLLTEASPSGETSIVLRPDEVAPVEAFLKERARDIEHVVRRDLGAVSIIGSGMSGMVGFAARVFGCLANEGVNVVAIAQTASERNVSVIVASRSVERAAGALHRAFVEGDGR